MGNNSLIGKIQTVNLLNTKTVTFTGNSILFSIDLQYTVKSSYTDYMYSKYHLFIYDKMNNLLLSNGDADYQGLTSTHDNNKLYIPYFYAYGDPTVRDREGNTSIGTFSNGTFTSNYYFDSDVTNKIFKLFYIILS